ESGIRNQESATAVRGSPDPALGPDRRSPESPMITTHHPSLIARHSSLPSIELIVEDSGPGPDAHQREHMFDPFYSGRKAGRGRGLGLSIAWRLARQLGGDVRFDEVPGSPTRFVLTLPPGAIASATPTTVEPLPHETPAAA